MSGCPSTSLEVKASSDSLKCVHPEVYHCLRDQVGEKTEKCIKPSWIQKGLCAEYNRIAERLDAKGCQLSRGLCPDKAYLSNDVISFSGCAPNEVGVTTINTTRSNNIPFESDGEGIPTGTIIVICCIAVICMIALGVAALVFFCRRRLGNTNEDAENTVPLISKKEEEEKQKYLRKEEEHLRFFAYKGVIPKHLIERTKEHLQNKNNVLIIGKPGSGKTTLAWALCKQMHGERFEGQRWYVKASTSTKNIPDKEGIKLILLLDGRFENAWTTEGTVEKVFCELEELRKRLPSKQMLIIATISNEAYKRMSKKDCTKKLKPMQIIDLDSKANGLTTVEMTEVLETYGISVRNVREAKESHVLIQDQLHAIYELNYPGKEANKSPKIGFPLIATLMSLNSPFISNNEFSKEPIKQILESIKRLRESSEVADKNKYCTLVYALFYWGYVDNDNVDKDVLTVIGEKHSHPGAKIDTDFYVLRKRSASVYEFLHESLHRAFFAAYGTQYMKFVIAHLPLHVLLEYCVSCREKNISDEDKVYFLKIGGIEYEKALIHRIIDCNVDIRHHRIWEQKGFRKTFTKVNAKNDA